MTEKRIEIVAIGEKHDYSVGAVIINDKGDIYVVHKIIDCDLKTSRHASGQRHWKSKKYTIFEKLGKTTEISKFKGYESLGIWAFGLESLPKLYEEYKMRTYSAIFFFDMRDYAKTAFNMFIAILTKEGLPTIRKMSNKFRKTHSFVFSETHPMIAITIADVNSAKEDS